MWNGHIFLVSNKLQGPGKTENSRIRKICNAAYKGNKILRTKGFDESTLTTGTYKLINQEIKAKELTLLNSARLDISSQQGEDKNQ